MSKRSFSFYCRSQWYGLNPSNGADVPHRWGKDILISCQENCGGLVSTAGETRRTAFFVGMVPSIVFEFVVCDD